jgi:hypothetical protein
MPLDRAVVEREPEECCESKNIRVRQSRAADSSPLGGYIRAATLAWCEATAAQLPLFGCPQSRGCTRRGEEAKRLRGIFGTRTLFPSQQLNMYRHVVYTCARVNFETQI